MAGCSEFLLVVSSLFVLVGATVPYKTAYLEQDLDHFNFVQANKVTFKQRYLYTGKACAQQKFFLGSLSEGA